MTILIVFGTLAAFWLMIVFFFTFLTTITALIWLPQIFNSIYKLGIYHRLVEKNNKNDESSRFGEYDSEKIWAVLKANLLVGASLFVVLIYIFNSFPISSFQSGNCAINKTINQTSSTAEMDQFNIKMSNGAFALTMLFVPTFLLSLRLIANPTQDWIKTIIETENRSSIEINNKIRYFKDQVISFYYSFIVGAIILFYFLILLVLYVNGGSVNLCIITPFMPKMDFLSVIFFIIIEFVAVIVITVFGEWYLKISPPIDQL